MGEPAGEHRQYEDLAVSHVLGGLDESDSRLFRAHLLACSDCRARVGELRTIAHELEDVERDERRSRAAQSLDTKQRADDEEADRGRRLRRPRRWGQRLLTLAVVVALVGLSLWNFALRSTVTRLEDNADRHSEAAALMELGAPGVVLATQTGVRGQVRVDGDRMALLIDGLDDATVYGVYIQDADGQSLFRAPARSRDGRLLAPMDLPAGADALLVTDRPPTGDPAGATVLHIRLPEDG
jgi:hypothetical protein